MKTWFFAALSALLLSITTLPALAEPIEVEVSAGDMDAIVLRVNGKVSASCESGALKINADGRTATCDQMPKYEFAPVEENVVIYDGESIRFGESACPSYDSVIVTNGSLSGCAICTDDEPAKLPEEPGADNLDNLNG